MKLITRTLKTSEETFQRQKSGIYLNNFNKLI